MTLDGEQGSVAEQVVQALVIDGLARSPLHRAVAASGLGLVSTCERGLGKHREHRL